MDDFGLDSLISDNTFQKTKTGIMLTNKEIEILKRYGIDYQNCHSLKEIIYYIEDILNDMDIVDSDLELIESSIAERDYYQNTNK